MRKSEKGKYDRDRRSGRRRNGGEYILNNIFSDDRGDTIIYFNR